MAAKKRDSGLVFLIRNSCSLNAPIHYYSSTALSNNTTVTITPGGNRGGGRDGGQGEGKEEVSVGDKEMDVFKMERKQMIADVLVLPYRYCQNIDDAMRLRPWMDKPYFVTVVIEGILDNNKRRRRK